MKHPFDLYPTMLTFDSTETNVIAETILLLLPPAQPSNPRPTAKLHALVTRNTIVVADPDFRITNGLEHRSTYGTHLLEMLQVLINS